MLIDLVLDESTDTPAGLPVNRREAVRAVVFSGGKLLMVGNDRGDCKLPGGGVESGESHAEALEREILEETGYRLLLSGPAGILPLGTVTERSPDSFDPGAVFEMRSHYYACHIRTDAGRGPQNLDGYEADQHFAPVWLTVSAALERNRAVLARASGAPLNDWVGREIRVLELLHEAGYPEGEILG